VSSNLLIAFLLISYGLSFLMLITAVPLYIFKVAIPLCRAILLVLSKEDLAAAKICQAITIASEGSIRPTVGTSYMSLVWLRDTGLITERLSNRMPNGKPRTLYSLTEAGRATVQTNNFDDLSQQRRRIG
jgi:DNA-binding PadR family transcriptional regulator